VTAKEIIPGLVDNHSHIGFPIQDANESPQSFVPQIRALDVLDPNDPRFKQALSGGVTTTVTGTGALIRQALVRAQEYRRQWDDYAGKPDSARAKTPPPGRQLGNDALVRLLKREAPARIQANTASDIRTAMRLAEEFGFEMILDSGSQAFELASELAAKKIPVVLGPVGQPFFSGDEVPDRAEYPAPDARSAATHRRRGLSRHRVVRGPLVRLRRDPRDAGCCKTHRLLPATAWLRTTSSVRS
jgi:imidazolonepropionase-like amidohydrolase